MSIHVTIALSLLMAGIAVVNAGLMAWLWRFPMVPDPTGRHAEGISSAPRLGTNIHRALGYIFVLTYMALLVEMVPRVWEYRTGTALSVLHAVLGAMVGILLTIKIAVIRRFRRFGHRLPWIGGALAITTLAVVALGAIPAWRVTRARTAIDTPQIAAGRAIVAAKCTQCHGASVILSEHEDLRKWQRLIGQMQRFSRRIPGKDPILDEERLPAATYLAAILGENDDRDDDDHDEVNDERDRDRDENDGDRGRRGRGRGRGR